MRKGWKTSRRSEAKDGSSSQRSGQKEFGESKLGAGAICAKLRHVDDCLRFEQTMNLNEARLSKRRSTSRE